MPFNTTNDTIKAIITNAEDFSKSTNNHDWIAIGASILGVFIAAFLAYMIQAWSKKKDRVSLDKSRMHYLAALLKGLRPNIVQLIKSTSEYLKELKEKPNENPIYGMMPLYDLDTINALSKEEYFLSYQRYFKKKQNRVGEFKKLFSTFDHIAVLYDYIKRHISELDLLKKENEKAIILNYNTVKKIVIEMYTDNEFAKSSVLSPFLSILNERQSDFIKSKSAENDFKSLNDLFIEPVINEIVEKYSQTPKAISVYNNLNEARTAYKNNISQTNFYLERIKMYLNKIEGQFLILEQSSKNILNENFDLR